MQRKICETGTRTFVHVVNCNGRLQTTRPIEDGTTGNASGNGVTGSDLASSARNPYCDYLDLDASCLRSELYHTRTGKMAARMQRLQKKDVSSTPPWKPAGVSSPTKCPHTSSPSPRGRNNAKKVMGALNKLCGQTNHPCVSSCLCGTVPLHIDCSPDQGARSKKRVSFRESLLPVTSEGMTICALSPSPEPTPSCVGSSSPEPTPSCVGSPSPEPTPSCVGSPSPEPTPSCVGSVSPEGSHSHTVSPEVMHNHIGGPPPEVLPSHIEGTPSAESSPFVDEIIVNHIQNSVPSTPIKSTSPESMHDPICTYSCVESSPSPEGMSSFHMECLHDLGHILIQAATSV